MQGFSIVGRGTLRAYRTPPLAHYLPNAPQATERNRWLNICTADNARRGQFRRVAGTGRRGCMVDFGATWKREDLGGGVFRHTQFLI